MFFKKNILLLLFLIPSIFFSQNRKFNVIKKNHNSNTGLISYYKLNNNGNNEIKGGLPIDIQCNFEKVYPIPSSWPEENLLKIDNDENYATKFKLNEIGNITLNLPDNFIISKHFSISFWMFPYNFSKYFSTKGNCDYCGRLDIFSTQNKSIEFYYYEGLLVLEFKSKSGLTEKFTYTYDYDHRFWNYVNIVFDNANIKLFLDDKEIINELLDFDLEATNSACFICNNSNFNGRIDEIKLFNKSLTKNEIDQQFYKVKNLSKQNVVLSTNNKNLTTHNNKKNNIWKFEITDWVSSTSAINGTRSERAYLKIYKNNQLYSTPQMTFTITDNDDAGLIVGATCNGFNSSNKYISDSDLDSTINLIIRDYIKSIDSDAKF